MFVLLGKKIHERTLAKDAAQVLAVLGSFWAAMRSLRCFAV
jgi:hypothetical protein